MTARIAVVTGAARGMGRAHALGLAQDGWTVGIWDLSVDALAETAREIAALGGRAVPAACDITDEDAVAGAVAELAQHGEIIALVNNAGIGSPPMAFADLALSDFRRMFEVHTLGCVACIQAVLPHMRRVGRGRIVNIASYCARSGSLGYAHYCTAKAAVVGLTRCLALEVAREGISVNAVAPGLIDTPMTASDPPDVRAAAVAGIPAGRYGRSEEVAALVRYLLSEEAGFLTGQLIGIDGAMVVA